MRFVVVYHPLLYLSSFFLRSSSLPPAFFPLRKPAELALVGAVSFGSWDCWALTALDSSLPSVLQIARALPVNDSHSPILPWIGVISLNL